MEYKEKLRLAKEALDSGSYDKETIEYIFPELAEAEEERIRKELLNAFKEATDSLYMVLTPSKREAFIAWLVKQGEQKPQGKSALEAAKEEKIDNANKVEPKFHEGDWLIYENGSICYVNKVYEHTYELVIDNGDKPRIPHELIDKKARLWTIQDAKDGDVLKEDSCIFIIEKMNPNGTAIVHCCLFDDGEFDLIGSTLKFDKDSTYPAPKEQRDLLFQKMKEAGYEWDTEKKELKKIEQKPAEWSEEDENRFKNLIALVEQSNEGKGTKEGFVKFINRLKSLRHQSTWKPSKEQMKALGVATNISNVPEKDYIELEKLYQDLEKLREE